MLDLLEYRLRESVSMSMILAKVLEEMPDEMRPEAWDTMLAGRALVQCDHAGGDCDGGHFDHLPDMIQPVAELITNGVLRLLRDAPLREALIELAWDVWVRDHAAEIEVSQTRLGVDPATVKRSVHDALAGQLASMFGPAEAPLLPPV